MTSKKQIVQLCQDYDIEPSVFFVSATGDIGIEELRQHLDGLVRSRCENKFIPSVYKVWEERLKQRCSALKPILSNDLLKLTLIDPSDRPDLEMDWDAFLNYQYQLGAVLVDQSKKLVCTDPSKYVLPFLSSQLTI